ncbi:hypothetical protein PoB_002407400 [Plakobranchus ocellatus]|uniref:Secreted protein n=1 Tax=Plakobranchus ocellatus TaxID=259542 RepID=A0AAV3ZUH8_9GAST|nr:hypothetical protein PoB_002407400 [Plakobranchus ocellatus]
MSNYDFTVTALLILSVCFVPSQPVASAVGVELERGPCAHCRGVVGTINSEAALKSAGTNPSRVRAMPPIHKPDGGPQASPQQSDLRLSDPPSGPGTGGGARTSDRRIPENIRENSLATVPPTSPSYDGDDVVNGADCCPF